jgi:hypothetical protein
MTRHLEKPKKDYATLVGDFARAGAAAHAAQKAAKAAFKDNLRSRDPAAYRALLEAASARMREAWPKGTPDLYNDLKNAKPRAIDTATAFLQADPFFASSGYLKAALIRRLKRATFTPEQKRRLQSVVLDRVMGPDRNEFAAYCRLALAVRSPELEAEVERLTEHEEYSVRRRARWMMLRFQSVPAPDRKSARAT